MPDLDSPASAALEALGFALFVRDESGSLRLAGEPPAWLRTLWSGRAARGAELPISEASPFLENFLIDAEACWSAGEGRVRSGPWVEQDAAGAEAQLEATALTAGGGPLLLVERLGEVFEAKKQVLQKARENVIAFQRLNAEMQKKEILLHCVAEDMTAALANAITALRLIELEPDEARRQTILGLASQAMEEQRGLIHRVLDVFADDLRGFYGRPAGADLHSVIRAAIEEYSPHFAEKGVRLTPPDFPITALAIAADAPHLLRVVGNLLENALHRTDAGGETALRLDDGSDDVTIRVEDGGDAGDRSLSTHLFSSLATSETPPEPVALRLHFCRIAVEKCGGDIGCEPRLGGGSAIWIRLPKQRPTP